MRKTINRTRRVIKRVARSGLGHALSLGNSRQCPICGWTGLQFLPVSHPRAGHFDSICPRCSSNERARLAYMVMKDRIVGTERVLHFAPEASLVKWLWESSGDYIACDLSAKALETLARTSGIKCEVVDIQAIRFPDESFDLVWCSHVLEHVPDDRLAMRELLRITRSGGTCLIQVPLWHEVTDEDPGVTDKAERERRFLQKDHVRIYGEDIVERLEECGFDVKVLKPTHFPPEQIFRHQIAQPGNYEVFLCTRH